MAEQHDVYISHAPEDWEPAEMLRCFLEQAGVRCVMGSCERPATVQAARLLLLVFSDHANNAASVHEEVTLAAATNIPMILFSTEDAPPKGGLEAALEGAFRIRAEQDHPVFSVSEVVCQVAKALGRELPGSKDRNGRNTPLKKHAHVRITTHPPGGHIRAIWPTPGVEGPSPFYLTATSSWVEIEATMEGHEPRTSRHDIDDDSCATDWRIGLRPLAAAQAAREKVAAEKLNDGGTSAEEVSEDLAERRRQWDLLDVDWQRALDKATCDVYLGARPGQPCEAGPITVVPRSDGCWVMDADRYDRLMRLYETRVLSGRAAGIFGGIMAALGNRRACDPHCLPTFLVEAIEGFRAGLLGEGLGPVAPCFDEFDEAAEACRGKWYVFDGDAYKRFSETVRSVSPRFRKS